MARYHLVISAVVAAQFITATIDNKRLVLTDLINRQEPGSATYSCHEACGKHCRHPLPHISRHKTSPSLTSFNDATGGAITQSRASDDPCNDEVFLNDYSACLECAGPDNEDIWKYYGETLSSVAEICGLRTSPEGGSEGGDELPSTTEPTSTDSITQSSTATPSEYNTVSAVPTTTTNGTAAATGIAQLPNIGTSISGNVYRYHGLVILGSLYIASS
ncbi:hypothetical protein NPX13_g3977 [Xylaria arbuscula]|uniref:Uncharacterized protein n=1 Tax=Xylaria arbuscula TaxID=114810 RepID=A0A9W8NGQ3_9PEZI|nr:hypothetical protein NPX13_g3977 [Xylaria arbuscula]